jgi:L-ascorbate metabolism protein UlaG (beta-lactamase superfamily)
MPTKTLLLTYIGGPTALLEFGGARFLTDPTFDPAGGHYPTGPVTLHKVGGPAISAENIGPVDYVLLSHDHHADNLDRAGRGLLSKANRVITTKDGAARLGGNSVGLDPWEGIDVSTADGNLVRIIATPARHGPADHDRGPVIGFVVSSFEAPSLHDTDAHKPSHSFYFSGDTVWYEGVAEIAKRIPVRVAILNLGAASVPQVGPFYLTMTASEAVETARAFAGATIVPLHFEGWAHFSEGRKEIVQAFADAGMNDRVRWPESGRAIQIDL